MFQVQTNGVLFKIFHKGWTSIIFQYNEKTEIRKKASFHI